MGIRKDTKATARDPKGSDDKHVAGAPKTSPTDDPRGDHDPEALEDAAKKMHADGDGDAENAYTRDPRRDHDPQALEDAAKKMGVER